MPVREGQWVTVPAEGDERQVAEVVERRCGEVVVRPQGGGQLRPVPLHLVETPSGRSVADTAAQLSAVRAA